MALAKEERLPDTALLAEYHRKRLSVLLLCVLNYGEQEAGTPSRSQRMKNKCPSCSVRGRIIHKHRNRQHIFWIWLSSYLEATMGAELFRPLSSIPYLLPSGGLKPCLSPTQDQVKQRAQHCSASCLGPFGDHFLLIWALQRDAQPNTKPGQLLVLLNSG